MGKADLPRCGAKTRSGAPCKRVAGGGTAHIGYGRCKNHGGASPNAQLAGAVELARREATAMAEPIPTHPIDAILHCVAVARGEVEYATERIAELQEVDYVGPEVSTRPLKLEKGAEHDTRRVEDHGPPAVHIWIAVRAKAMDRLTQYSQLALRAGIDERRVRLAENQARQLLETIRGIIAELAAAFAFATTDPRITPIVRKHLELASASAPLPTVNGHAKQLASV